jgi:hypothetical protein
MYIDGQRMVRGSELILRKHVACVVVVVIHGGSIVHRDGIVPLSMVVGVLSACPQALSFSTSHLLVQILEDKSLFHRTRR